VSVQVAPHGVLRLDPSPHAGEVGLPWPSGGGSREVPASVGVCDSGVRNRAIVPTDGWGREDECDRANARRPVGIFC